MTLHENYMKKYILKKKSYNSQTGMNIFLIIFRSKSQHISYKHFLLIKIRKYIYFKYNFSCHSQILLFYYLSKFLNKKENVVMMFVIWNAKEIVSLQSY